MENKLTRQIIHVFLSLIGLAVIAIGIITEKHGAIVIGIIVSGVNAHQWIQWIKKTNKNATWQLFHNQ